MGGRGALQPQQYFLLPSSSQVLQQEPLSSCSRPSSACNPSTHSPHIPPPPPPTPLPTNHPLPTPPADQNHPSLPPSTLHTPTPLLPTPKDSPISQRRVHAHSKPSMPQPDCKAIFQRSTWRRFESNSRLPGSFLFLVSERGGTLW